LFVGTTEQPWSNCGLFCCAGCQGSWTEGVCDGDFVLSDATSVETASATSKIAGSLIFALVLRSLSACSCKFACFTLLRSFLHPCS
jgi:hypothetical protein